MNRSSIKSVAVLFGCSFALMSNAPAQLSIEDEVAARRLAQVIEYEERQREEEIKREMRRQEKANRPASSGGGAMPLLLFGAGIAIGIWKYCT